MGVAEQAAQTEPGARRRRLRRRRGCRRGLGLGPDLDRLRLCTGLLQVGDKGRFECVRVAAQTDGFGGVADQHLAGVHQRHAVAALGFVHEVGGDEDGHVVVARQIDHQLPEHVACDRIDTRSRFVEDQQCWLVHHRNGQRQALANAQGQLAGQHMGHAGQVETFHHFADAASKLRCRYMEKPRVQHQVLVHGELGIKRKRLRHVAYVLPRCNIVRVDLLAEQPGLARAGGQQPGQHLHGGRFAAAIGTKKAEDLSAPDAKIDAIDGDEITETHRQILGFDGDFLRFDIDQWRHDDFVVTTAPFLRQQRYERRFQSFGAGAFAEFLRRAARQYAPGIHRQQPVETIGFIHIGGGDDHAHAGALGANALDQLPELAACQWIDARGRLIEDQQVRIVDQRAAQPELLLHAARQLSCRTREKRVQTGAARQVVDAAPTLGGAVAEEAGEKLQVFLDRQGRIQVLAQPLRHVGNARANPASVSGVGHVAAQHLQTAGLQGPRSGKQRQQARLADPIRANESDHAGRGHLKAHVVERHHLAEMQAHAFEVCDRRRI